MSNTLDSLIARLQNINPFNIHEVVGEGADVKPWFEVTGGIVSDLIVHEVNLTQQVQAISAQIMHWGRLTAQAKRVWEIEERRYRVWRDGKSLEFLDPKIKPDGWKKPALDKVKQMVSVEPEYTAWYKRQERAEEAYNACTAILDGFRAKKDMMKAAIIRQNEDSAPRLSI